MSAEFAVTTPVDPQCPVCGTPVTTDASRCRECGMHFGGDATPGPFRGAWFWGFAGSIAGVYAVTILFVALAR